MNDLAKGLQQTVETAAAHLLAVSELQAGASRGEGRWSAKEILGHLIDSAANNHQRFVRASCNAAAAFPPYNQNDWVRIQQYHESEWSELVILWSAYNRHLSDVIERIPAESLSAPCNIGKEEPVQLEFVIRDYLRHLRHHLNQILGKQA